MAYADDITITFTHTSTSAAKKYIQPYLHKKIAWTKQNNLLLNPDKTYVLSSIVSSTSINKLQVMQNAALRTATGWTQDTKIQHLYGETLTFPIHEHLQLHASQYKQKTQHPSHPLHKHTTYFNTPKLKKNTISNNGGYITNIPTDPHTVTTTDIKTNLHHIHTYIVSMHLATRGNNKILRKPPPHISSSEEGLPRLIRRPTQNKQISLPQIIITQSRRQNTYIITMRTL